MASATNTRPKSGGGGVGGPGAIGSPGRTTKPINIKLVLLGEAAVGKSSMVLRFVANEFTENREPTIGAAFLTQKCDVGDKTIKFEFWDTAGQERFHSLAPMYYRNAQAAVVVFDITNMESLVKAKSWVKELQRQAAPNIVIALAGNKVDLASKREVSTQEAEAYAQDAGLLYTETSAKDNIGITELFTEIASKVPLDLVMANQKKEGINLNKDAPDPNASEGKGCAC